MDNLKLPAYPGVIPQLGLTGDNTHAVGNKEHLAHGLTKLELASLMIAQGDVGSWVEGIQDQEKWARNCVKLAKAVLEEANK